MKESSREKILRRIKSGKVVCGSAVNTTNSTKRVGTTACLSLADSKYCLEIEKYHVDYGSLEDVVAEEERFFEDFNEAIDYMVGTLNINIGDIR